MHQHHDQHHHRDLEIDEEPLDAANQSLADALKTSFSILKALMVVLLVLYLFSNVSRLESHEEALVLRMGRLLPGKKQAGLAWAYPYPIDEVVKLPTRKSNDMVVSSHTFARRENEKGKPLSMLSRGAHSGLDPSLDGALLTADSGLVHVEWRVTYKIVDVNSYVREMKGKKVEAAEDLLRTLVETVGIHVASEMTAEELIRTRIDDVQRAMKSRINDRLAQLDSGIEVTFLEMFEWTPPLQVREAFLATQKAESTKERRISQAKQERTAILSGAAGSAHEALIAVLDAIDAGPTPDKSIAQLQAELDDLLTNEVEGRAGEMITGAGAFLSVEVGRIRSDLEQYRGHVAEYERNPALLIERLWEETRQKIYASPGVSKLFRAPGMQVRLHIPLDPDETRMQEERRLQKETFDPTTLRREALHPIGVGQG